MAKKNTFFSELIDKHFSRLVTQYGFKKIESDKARGEYWVKFQNKTTQITFYCVVLDYYEDPWIKINDLSGNGQGTLLEVLLHFLDVEHLPEFGKQPIRLNTIEELEERMKLKSQQLYTYAKEFLKGDFYIMPKLEELTEKRINEYEKHKNR